MSSLLLFVPGKQYPDYYYLCPENNIPFDLLHGLQYQQVWLGQRPLHNININGLAHNPNIANSSSLHRKCASTLLSAAGQLRNRTPSERVSNPAVTIRQADLENDLLESRVRIQF